MTKLDYARLTPWLIAAWFAVALSAAALGLIQTTPGRPPLPLLISLVVPLTTFGIWYAASPTFREFVLSLDPRSLTQVQILRLMGFVFLVLASYQILPKGFALSAGWGDIIVGATAIFAMRLAAPKHRNLFVLWQVLGITDLVTAITLGATAAFRDPHGIPATPMEVMPMSLITTFGVPLFLLLHIISIAQARRWSREQSPALGTHYNSATV